MLGFDIRRIVKVPNNNVSLKTKVCTHTVYLFVFLCIVKCGVISAEKLQAFNPDFMEKAPTKFKIYPYLLSDLPKYPLKFGKRKIHFGNRLDWEDVKYEPTLVHWPVKKDKEYILAALGPDGTGIWSVRCFFEHWLVGNIPENSVKKGNFQTEYLGIDGLYHGIGWFRIIFVAFEQPEKNLTFDGAVLPKPSNGIAREAFSMKDFKEHFHLGAPLAVNFCVVYNNATELPY